MYENDNRTVLTLDAGGTNFVFSAIRGCQVVVTPVRLDAVTDKFAAFQRATGAWRKVKPAYLALSMSDM